MRKMLLSLSLAAMVAAPAHAAAPESVDWSKVPSTTVALFYPGQSTYQWVRSPDHKRADAQVRDGEACKGCHEDEEIDIGDNIVQGSDLEPTPVDGKNGSIDLGVQVAYDDTHAYFRFTWKTLNDYPGMAHPYWRYDGSAWKQFGYPKLDEVVQSGEQPGIYEDRFSMMIDDGSVPHFAEHGCWLTCHEGERDNPGQPTADEVRANELYKAIGKKDVRKYLPSTRDDDEALWDAGKTVEAIAKIKAAGGFVDLMQWRGHRSNPVGMADDFYVLEYRNSDAGKNPFSKNWDDKAKQPKYMYDASKFGSKATNVDDIRDKPTALVREDNAVPFDPNAGWKEGDLIPEYVVSRADASGSAADNSQVKGSWADGVWTVVWARPLNLQNPDDKALKNGAVYNFGFAVHDDNITTRGHHVSFPLTVGFGVEAEIEATALK